MNATPETTTTSDSAGERVFAVRNADQTTVYLYGFGVHQGSFPRPGSGTLTGVWGDDEYQMALDAISRPSTFDPALWFDQQVAGGTTTRAQADAELAAGKLRVAAREARPVHERVADLLARLDLNPRILLDDGGYVWGCQCWWGDEARFETDVRKGRALIIVDSQDSVGNLI